MQVERSTLVSNVLSQPSLTAPYPEAVYAFECCNTSAATKACLCGYEVNDDCCGCKYLSAASCKPCFTNSFSSGVRSFELTLAPPLDPAASPTVDVYTGGVLVMIFIGTRLSISGVI